MFGQEGYEIAAVNDLTSARMLRYLLKYDSSQGPYEKAVDCGENTLTVDGKQIRIYAERDPENLPWRELGIDVVLECTGFFASKAKSTAHIKAGAKRVVISAPAGSDLPTIVFGVNEKTLKSTDTVISAASCTTNCLALMANTLNNLAPIKNGYMTTIHAYTNDQNTQDAPHAKGDLRRARAAALNIVPTSSGAAKAIGLVIPALSGRLDGVSQRVPVSAGSLTDLVAVVKGQITKEEIDAAMKKDVSESFGYTDEQIVSSDIIGMRYGSLYDATQTKVMDMGEDTLVKVDAWYDNENSYVSQMVRTIRYFANLSYTQE
jgi:glyceraldehyde 3-phosphate dehydrogenase